MITRLTPILPVVDVRDELGFYLQLGFEQHIDPAEIYPIDDFAAVAAGDAVLFGLARHDSAADLPPAGLAWQFETSDIEHLDQRASSAGLNVTEPVTLQSWGRQTMTITSPSGYAVTFEQA